MIPPERTDRRAYDYPSMSRTRAEEIAALRRTIDASGLSARQWAIRIALRDERTVRRWLKGERQIPKVVLERIGASTLL